MGRRDYGIIEGLVRQPGRQLVYKQDGTISGQVKYRCDGASLFMLIPRVGAPHPDNQLAKCYNATATVLENGIGEIVCDYLGILRDPTTPQTEFIGNTGEEPVETHKDFVSRIGGSKDAPLNRAKFDLETGEFLGFPPDAPNDLGGVRGYLNPTCTVRVSFYTANSSWGLYSLGDISSPPANIPSPPDGRNWLKTNWSRRDFGLIYQITQEYTASGRRGWNPLLYS